MDNAIRYGDIWFDLWLYIIIGSIVLAFVYWYRRRLIYVPSEATPDIDMADAIDHVVSVLFPDNNPDNTNFVNEIDPAALLIIEKLRSGELTAWGKRVEAEPSHVLLKYMARLTNNGKLLKKEDWMCQELIPISASIPRDDEPQTKYFGSGEKPIQFTALRVNRNQVKQLWPAKNTKASKRSVKQARPNRFPKNIPPK